MSPCEVVEVKGLGSLLSQILFALVVERRSGPVTNSKMTERRPKNNENG